MRKILTILSLTFPYLLSSAVAQDMKSNDGFLGINHQFHESDTTRSFALISDHTDLQIQHFIDQYHLVDLDSLEGLYSFGAIDIPGLGNDLAILIKDGILTTSPDNSSAWFRPFEHKAEKSDRLQNLKSNELRVVEIIILDKQGNNIINTDEKQDIALQYLYAGLQL
ncbi:MAG: hypothetical protein KL787_07020 [Taibaiella sp.]|nr:hypothetical protein [Taibaiella sp.]